MIRHSTSGLTMLPPERAVTVVDEEQHQATLARFAPAGGTPRPVVVELHHAPVARGTHAGRPGIEILLDGHRVGELTYRMAQRYGPVVEQVVRRGERPGARATLTHGRRGLVEVELKLPAVGVPAPAVPDVPGQRRAPVPAAPAPEQTRRLLWIGGVVGTVLVVGGIIGGNNGSVPRTPVSDVAASATGAPAPVPTAPVSTAPPVAVVPAPAPAPDPMPEPEPDAAPEPAPEPEPEAAPEPAASDRCDPHYSGCVPVASDVDCAGGSGDGPAYVSGPVRVIGSDIYRLDADKNGIACA